MKILSDFDGVLTELSRETERVRELFVQILKDRTPDLSGVVDDVLLQAEAKMTAEPFRYGWRMNGRISAFCNEDGFIRVNALGACLDDCAGAQAVRERLDISFTEVAQQAYMAMTHETASGKLHPVDDATFGVIDNLLTRGHEVVVVSNSGTERILQILSGAGLSPVAHGAGEGRLRVRGDARKFALGNTPRCFSVGLYEVDTDRPSYEKILLEEKPAYVIGDVFSLDLALPAFFIGKKTPGFEKSGVVLRKRQYTPSWSLEHLGGAFGREVNGVVIDQLDQLGSLV